MVYTLHCYSMACIRRVSLIVNCGYARVSIYENSNPARNGRNARQTIDTTERLTEFKAQFSTHQYGFPDDYFEPHIKDPSMFDRDCSKILKSFSLKFRSECGFSRETYLQTFSSLKWSHLPASEKKQHTFSNCVRCSELHMDHQLSFPLKPLVTGSRMQPKNPPPPPNPHQIGRDFVLCRQ